MDWYTIEYLYPESFKKFTEVMFPNVGMVSLSILSHYDIKKLYGFFDNEGVYLIIEKYTNNNWSYSISTHNGFTFVPSQINRETRDEIEIDGFIECFKTLDKKIINKIF
jgi:hypothetical protein